MQKNDLLTAGAFCTLCLWFIFLVSGTGGSEDDLSNYSSYSPDQRIVLTTVHEEIDSDDLTTPELELAPGGPTIEIEVFLPTIVVRSGNAHLGNGWQARVGDDFKVCALRAASKDIAVRLAGEAYYASLTADGTYPGVPYARQFNGDMLVAEHKGCS